MPAGSSNELRAPAGRSNPLVIGLLIVLLLPVLSASTFALMEGPSERGSARGSGSIYEPCCYLNGEFQRLLFNYRDTGTMHSPACEQSRIPVTREGPPRSCHLEAFSELLCPVAARGVESVAVSLRASCSARFWLVVCRWTGTAAKT